MKKCCSTHNQLDEKKNCKMSASPSIIDQIFDQTTTCDDLKWNDEYRTKQHVTEIVRRSDTALTSTANVEKVGWFLMELGFKTNEGRKLASIESVRDLILKKCCPLSTTPSS